MGTCPGRRRRAGFTLVEMLLVIVIIGVLAGTVAVSLSGRSEEARQARVLADFSQLRLALDLFDQDTGRYPTSGEGLEALVRDPGVSGWRKPYLVSGLKLDPWGASYLYAADDNGQGQFRLASAGPDGQHGTADDITE
jgi:general secretion pathway protein G